MHVAKSNHLPSLHVEHLFGPESSQLLHVSSHLSQVHAVVFSNFPTGHSAKHVVPSKCLPGLQEVHCVFSGPVHVAHVDSQGSHFLFYSF